MVGGDGLVRGWWGARTAYLEAREKVEGAKEDEG